jgi:probable O-glycosylation ligase (exosortase A-associated)
LSAEGELAVRDYILVALFLVTLPLGIFQPYYGVLIYAWISYMYPHQLAWSFVQTLPVAKVAAASATLGLVIRRNGSFDALRRRECITMLALLLVFTLSSVFALERELAWTRWEDLAKIILMSLVTAMLLTERKRLRVFILVVALSLAFYGIKGGIFSLLTGGEFLVWGPGNSVIAGNNNIGLALNMALPMFWYLAKEQQNKWFRRFLHICFLLTIPSVMFTYSRASAIALVVVLAAIFLKEMRFFLLISIAVLAMAAIPFIPEQWWERQRSTLSYELDGSAMSRIDNWVFCWNLVQDRPLIGGGFNYNTPVTFDKYAPGFREKYGNRQWDSHSIYFGIMAAHGFAGLFLFLLMILFCLLTCRSIKKKTAAFEDLRWAGYYAAMIQVSFLGLLVNGAFVNMEYFDLNYHLTALTACLAVIVDRSLASSSEPPARSGVDAMQLEVPAALP